MRQIVPEFHVYLVRLIDGGHLLPRAHTKLAFKGIAPGVVRVPELDDLLTRDLTIDLFEQAPQRERNHVESVQVEAEGIPQRKIAREIIEKPKQATVFKALALHRQMLTLGLDSPYSVLREPPNDYPKLRRHLNRKYRFVPLDGYRPPEI